MRLGIKVLLLTSALLITTGCAVKSGNEKLGTVEKEKVQQALVRGKSTKDDVKTFLGDPDKTDFDNNSLEKWTYTHVRKDAKFVNYIPIVNWFGSGTNDTTKTLVVIFDDNGIVKNYINSDAKGETKGGLFQ